MINSLQNMFRRTIERFRKYFDLITSVSIIIISVILYLRISNQMQSNFVLYFFRIVIFCCILFFSIMGISAYCLIYIGQLCKKKQNKKYISLFRDNYYSPQFSEPIKQHNFLNDKLCLRNIMPPELEKNKNPAKISAIFQTPQFLEKEKQGWEKLDSNFSFTQKSNTLNKTENLSYWSDEKFNKAMTTLSKMTEICSEVYRIKDKVKNFFKMLLNKIIENDRKNIFELEASLSKRNTKLMTDSQKGTYSNLKTCTIDDLKNEMLAYEEYCMNDRHYNQLEVSHDFKELHKLIKERIMLEKFYEIDDFSHKKYVQERMKNLSQNFDFEYKYNSQINYNSFGYLGTNNPNDSEVF